VFPADHQRPLNTVVIYRKSFSFVATAVRPDRRLCESKRIASGPGFRDSNASSGKLGWCHSTAGRGSRPAHRMSSSQGQFGKLLVGEV
jgi:hypothetical protein